jgi:hypothetical protein
MKTESVKGRLKEVFVALAIVMMLTGCLSGSGTSGGASGPTLSSIAITPTTTTASLGAGVQFTAKGTFSDGSSSDITNTAIWTSSAPSIADFSFGAGWIFGGAIGSTNVIASTLSGISSAPTAVSVVPVVSTTTPTGNLITGRSSHTATLLANGKVLVTGGNNNKGSLLTSCELYDPATNSWTATGNLITARESHTATLLSNGKVLVAGGLDSSVNPTASSELYNPTTGQWTATGSLATKLYAHTATLLSNGKVLIAGGSAVLNEYTGTTSAELYDPTAGIWTTTGSLTKGRTNNTGVNYTAMLLSNGQVLLAGGGSGMDLFDPATSTWTARNPTLDSKEYNTFFTLLTNGKVLIIDSSGNGSILTQLYDPTTDTTTATANPPSYTGGASIVTLPNGNVLTFGGNLTGNVQGVFSSSIINVRTLMVRDMYSGASKIVGASDLLTKSEAETKDTATKVGVTAVGIGILYCVSTGNCKK